MMGTTTSNGSKDDAKKEEDKRANNCCFECSPYRANWSVGWWWRWWIDLVHFSKIGALPFLPFCAFYTHFVRSCTFCWGPTGLCPLLACNTCSLTLCFSSSAELLHLCFFQDDNGFSKESFQFHCWSFLQNSLICGQERESSLFP